MRRAHYYLLAGIALLFLLGCTPTRSAKELKEARLKSIITNYREGDAHTFIAEPAPGLRVACVWVYSGLWCVRREAGETW